MGKEGALMMHRRELLKYLGLGCFGNMACQVTMAKSVMESIGSPQAVSKEQLMSMSFASIDIRQLLQMLADAKGINMMISEKVSGVTGIHMKNATWQSIFDSVLASRSLAHQYEAGVL